MEDHLTAVVDVKLTRSGVLILLIITLLVPVRAVARDGPTYFGIESGRCILLLIAGKDYTSECAQKFTNATFTNGHVGFTFIADDKYTVTFDGYGPSQVKLSANTTSQPITTILYIDDKDAVKGLPPTTMPANGVCIYSNPFQGKPVTTTCRADTHGLGSFAATFTSNGAPPDEMPIH
jgi:hypothetical protein